MQKVMIIVSSHFRGFKNKYINSIQLSLEKANPTQPTINFFLKATLMEYQSLARCQYLTLGYFQKIIHVCEIRLTFIVSFQSNFFHQIE